MLVTPQKLKIGIIGFVNALPFFHEIEKHPLANSFFEFTYGKPKEINQLLEEGHLDTALISSASFLTHRSKYVLLSALGIASKDKILSVKLFYKGEICDLSTIYIPPYSETSTALLKILCKHHWKIKPRFVESPNTTLANKKAFLSIGDDCLRRDNFPNYSSIDLGHEWRKQTGTPFVYAVFATRIEALKTKRPQLKSLYRLIEAQLEQFESNPIHAVQQGAKTIQCSQELIKTYFDLIDYRFTEEHFSGLEQYASLR